ncbi:MAG: PAS domain S-box protein [Paucibacter sp.]|nr:PAS domain S-box protein [Roseateles sp.]
MSRAVGLAGVLEAVTVPVLVHAGKNTEYANDAMQRLLGYKLSELQAMPFEAWAIEADRERLRQYGMRCLEIGAEMAAIEIEACTSSGSIRTIELTARPLANTVQAVFTCQDLSDIRHVQTSLLDVSQVLHQIIEGTPVATFVIDAQHRITHWNTACA